MFKFVFILFYLRPLAANAELTFPIKSEGTFNKNSSTSTTQADWVKANYKETIPPELKDIVIRKGKELTIKKGDNVLAEFRDIIYEEEALQAELVVNRFDAFNKKNKCISILTIYYEGFGETLINYASGDRISIPPNPIWSPSESRFATVLLETHGEGSSATAIWHIENAEFVKKIEVSTYPLEKNAMFLDSAKWISENEVNFFASPQEGLNCKFRKAKWSCERFKKPGTPTTKKTSKAS